MIIPKRKDFIFRFMYCMFHVNICMHTCTMLVRVYVCDLVFINVNVNAMYILDHAITSYGGREIPIHK